ncbi:hypothetical protein [Streptomyces sp. NPDC058335]
MDTEEDRRLGPITPDNAQITVDLLRRVVGSVLRTGSRRRH